MASEAERSARKAADALGNLPGAVAKDVVPTAKEVGRLFDNTFGSLLTGVTSFFSGEKEVKDMSPDERKALQMALNMTAGYRGPMDGSDDPKTLGQMKTAVQTYADAHPNPDAEKPVRGVDNNSDIAIDNDTLKDIVSDANARAMNGEKPYIEPPAAPPPTKGKSGKGR